MNIRMEKGPQEVLRALASGDPDQIAEALAFQRESFHARFGCYPEELVEVFDPHPDCPDPLHLRDTACPTCGTSHHDWKPRKAQS